MLEEIVLEKRAANVLLTSENSRDPWKSDSQQYFEARARIYGVFVR